MNSTAQAPLQTKPQNSLQKGSAQPSVTGTRWFSAALCFAPLALLAELLIAKTNHRPLGAATFTTIAVVMWVCAEVINRRLLDPTVCERRAMGRKVMWAVSSFLSAAVVIRALIG